MKPPLEGRFEERELTAPVDLCTPDGRLNRAAVGWARTPLVRCNLRGHPLRKKRWNYWCVTSPTHLFSATVSDVDYVGLTFIYFYERATGRFVEQTVTAPLGRGCNMPERVGERVRFADRRLTVDLAVGPDGGAITVRSPDAGGQPLEAALSLRYPPGHDTLNVVIPWSDQRFQFTGKHNCLPVTGTVTVAGEAVEFPEGASWACLDFGRGVWPYRTVWNWGSASGRSDGATVGLNLGGQWTDGTHATENGVCVDGRLEKIGEDLRWEYDRAEFMRPWRIRTRASDRIDLTFTPEYDRASLTDLLVIRSEGHQMFGCYAGHVTGPDGRRVQVDGLFGWAEEHRARW